VKSEAGRYGHPPASRFTLHASRFEEFLEIFSVGLVVGGSIVIPHLRRAMARLEEISEVPPAPA
jgi:hypothetical protein